MAVRTSNDLWGCHPDFEGLKTRVRHALVHLPAEELIFGIFSAEEVEFAQVAAGKYRGHQGLVGAEELGHPMNSPAKAQHEVVSWARCQRQQVVSGLENPWIVAYA